MIQLSEKNDIALLDQRKEEVKATILYVDDEEYNLKVFKSAFRRYFNVITLMNPEEGIHEVRNKEIDVVVTDQRMPNMSGTEMLEIIKSEFPDIISIIITGYSDIETVIYAVNHCNIFRYVTKPYDIKDLKYTLERAVQMQNLRKEKENLLTELSHVNKILSSSIEYARHIQNAVISPPDNVSAFFSESMRFFKPLHVVSGDFNYTNLIAQGVLVGAFDCTGHGVPGAFLSMLGVSSIEKALAKRKIYPNEIIKEVNNQFYRQLKPAQNETQDGMDGGLVLLDKENQLLHFAGINNEILFFRDGKLHKIKGDKLYLGTDLWFRKNPVQLHTISTEGITEFYLFSDGYKDQLNESSKRIGSAKIRQMLTGIHHQPMEVQQQFLEEYFQSWKGKEEQTDDILFLGFRLK